MDSKVAATAGPPIREAWGCQTKKGAMGVTLSNSHHHHRDRERPTNNGSDTSSLNHLNIVETNHTPATASATASSAAVVSAPDVLVTNNGQCHCCPYGYHIDLDFVRYCEAMANGEYVRQLKRLHRDRRKQRKSMEALLSFHEDQLKRKNTEPATTIHHNHQVSAAPPPLPPPPPSLAAPPQPDVVSNNDAARDALREAMLDFEDTFKNSTLPRDAGSNHHHHHHHPHQTRHHHLHPPSSLELVPMDLLSNARRVTLTSTSSESGSSDASSPNLPGGIGLCYHRHLSSGVGGASNGYESPPFSRSRSGSVSSVCSSVATAADDAAAEACRRVTAPSQQMADTMNALDNSMFRGCGLGGGGGDGALSVSGSFSGRSASPVVGINPSVLQSIRDQMSVSLNRMKELEEHAKAIPVLQVKLSVLKEEKRLLMLQLKAKAARLDLRSVGVGDSPVVCSESSDSEYNGDVILAAAATTNGGPIGVSTSNGLSKPLRPPPPEPPRRTTRTAGVNCVTMTRDIGVSHVPIPTRDVSTNCGDIAASATPSTTPHSFAAPPTKPCAECELRRSSSPEKIRINTTTVSVNTDKPLLGFSSCSSQSIAPKPCELCETRRHKSYRTIAAETDDTLTRWSHDQLDKEPLPPPPPPPVHAMTTERGTNTFRILTHHAGVQALPTYRSTALQTTPTPPPPVPQKPATHSRKVGCEVEVRHFGATVNGRLLIGTCDVGVGERSIHDLPVCEVCAAAAKRRETARTIGVGLHAVSDLLCDRCSRVKTCSVGVGTADAAWPRSTTRTIGSGVSKTTDVVCDRCENLCTSSVGVATDPQPPSVAAETKPVNLCDKCNAAITSVAQDLVHGQPVLRALAPRLQTTTPVASSVSSTGSSQGGRLVNEIAAPAGPPPPPPRPPARDYRKRRPPPREFYMDEGFGKSESSQPPQLPSRGQTKPKAPGSPPTKDVGLLKVVSDSSESSDSSDDDDSDSPDEASYDSVRGVIVHSCKDDEAIRQGVPGAVMFQPIVESPREKFFLNDEVKGACRTVDDFLKSSSKVPTKEVNSSLNLIRQDWFRISSQKTTDQHAVEDYLDELEIISHPLLHNIVNLVDASGNTALHYAISYANFDVVSLLLDSKVCDISKPNKAGYSCIMLASLASIKEESHLSVLRQLFKLGDVNAKASQHGQTALMLAASHGKLEMLKLLLEAGADVNIQDDDGSTSLMCASEHGHLGIVKYLLAHVDCDPNITDNDGSNALAIAMEAGHKDIGLLIYASTSLSRGNSPYASLRLKRSGSTPTRHVSTPPPQTPPPPSPARSRKSTSSVC